ncbi:MAG: 30S ribosomal protein S12 methylthiotransferase RimO [Proteobacteria bacterium]|nr:MAG: 30S ribosomal protein S12 methylthiotransferase RimO [Pseudomonadota bacterium]
MLRRTSSVGFVSLGCPKALVDSERILTRLRAEGYDISQSYEDSDVVVVNTCGFIESAVEESLDAIGEAMAENGKVVVTGCLGVRAGEIFERFPDVLSITGPQDYDSVMDAIHRAAPPPPDPFTSLIPPGGIKLTPRHYAYLKIAEGCNHKCTFCIIPGMRGPLVSRRADEVLVEAGRLVEAGVRELLVVSQDTSAYGVDLRYAASVHDGREVPAHLVPLARELGRLGVWVRFHYIYPYPHVDKLVPLMADGLVLPYLDVPLQHAAPRILKAMRRPANAEDTMTRIRRWREICPEIAIRSSFIVGFPGETDSDFERLLEFLAEARLDRVGCFEYSPVDGAAANALPGEVPEDIRGERRERLMALQEAISRERLQERIGRRETVLVDEIVEQDTVVARSYADAPEIDGKVYMDYRPGIEVGDFVEVVITDSDFYDLVATPVTLQGDESTG